MGRRSGFGLFTALVRPRVVDGVGLSLTRPLVDAGLVAWVEPPTAAFYAGMKTSAAGWRCIVRRRNTPRPLPLPC